MGLWKELKKGNILGRAAARAGERLNKHGDKPYPGRTMDELGAAGWGLFTIWVIAEVCYALSSKKPNNSF